MNDIYQSLRQAGWIAKYMEQQLSPEEEKELNAWLSENPANKAVFDQLTNEHLLKIELQQLESVSIENAWEKISGQLASKAKPVPFLTSARKWWLAAAAVALMGGLWLVSQIYSPQASKTGGQELQGKSRQKIMPGSDKAMLTLADGSIIELDSNGNGELARQGMVKISKLDGKIAYTPTGSSAEPVVNMISTPRGGQYQIELADGSKVWLNAASSLRFPSFFPDAERVVEMTGECYFEVAQNASSPFKVKVNGLEVLVTGTHFNINSYADEASQHITLAEGAVEVIRDRSHMNLLPGQQVRVLQNGSLNLLQQVDLKEILAWKEGAFIFNSADVQTIMRQISRWYNVEVVYQGEISKETFSGIVSRQSNISRILKIMEVGGFTFKTEGNKIIVYNN